MSLSGKKAQNVSSKTSSRLFSHNWRGRCWRKRGHDEEIGCCRWDDHRVSMVGAFKIEHHYRYKGRGKNHESSDFKCSRKEAMRQCVIRPIKVRVQYVVMQNLGFNQPLFERVILSEYICTTVLKENWTAYCYRSEVQIQVLLEALESVSVFLNTKNVVAAHISMLQYNLCIWAARRLLCCVYK